ncbi:MAG: radical SAM protein [Deltaproteobacteria bacterium]|nr:radical SAM protein [Deltaproteobacteria bacterium]
MQWEHPSVSNAEGRMKRLVLVNPPLTMEERYGNLAKAGSRLPPLGLCNLAAVARTAGVETTIVDAPARGWGIEETWQAIEKFAPDLIGITAVTISVFNAAALARYIREKGHPARIVLGGPHVTAVPEDTLQRFLHFDFAAIGEAEDTLTELLAWDGTSPLDGIAGLAIRRGDEVVRTAPRPFIKDLDRLPMPAWDLLEGYPTAYSQSAMRSHRFPTACLITSRGCYGKCTFCDVSCFGRKPRKHGAEYVIRLVNDLIERYGVKDISFYDDNFLDFPSRIDAICHAIIDQKIDITWSCDARIDTIRSPEQLEMFRKAGCWQILYGIESGSQMILDEVKKNVTLDKIREVVGWTARAGIAVKGFFMMGLPLETEETMKETIRFALELPLTNAHVTFATPLPGSELYTTASKYGAFDNDWRKMNMWSPVFVPHGVTAELMEKYKKKFFRDFYFRPRIVATYLRNIRHPRQALSLANGFITLLTSLVRRGR